MRLFKTGENEQNAYYKWVPNGQKYVSWKDIANSKTIVVSKSVQNSLPDNIKNATTNCGFIANPIKHPRKQYINLNGTSSGFSKFSYIGSLDKPGSENITSVDCDTLHQTGSKYIIDMSEPPTCETKCFVTKPATTVINSDYAQSHKALLHKRCKTINQNLPSTSTKTNLTDAQIEDCSTTNNCRTTFVPSNTRYQVQGSLSSSARTAALRYCTQDGDDALSRRCYLPATNYSITQQKADGLSSTMNVPCKTECGIPIASGKKRYGIRVFVPGMA
jgi:hypothetical protein